MKRLIIITIAIAGLLFAGGIWYSLETPKAEITQIPVYTPSKYEVGPPDPQEMLELVNIERAKVGVAPLTIDENVQKSAQMKADDFSERDYYSHTIKGYDSGTLTQEMAYYVNLSCVSSSENINADVYTSKQAFNKWMDSPPHRAAILDDKFTLTGFGVSNDKDGDYYAVQHFCVAK